jgi:hypothetical protein
MKYDDAIITAFLTAFLIFASIAIVRMSQIKTDARLTREAMEQLRDDARTYQEWIERVTAPVAVCK